MLDFLYFDAESQDTTLALESVTAFKEPIATCAGIGVKLMNMIHFAFYIHHKIALFAFIPHS